MHIEIVTSEFNALEKLASYQARLPQGKYGAACHFVGSMRDFNQGDEVQAMTLEHYPGMTEKSLQNIVEQAMQKWPLLDAVIIHRVGEIRPSDDIVLCAVWSAHRDEAFTACRFLIEALKTQAPFWKREQLEQSQQPRWVQPTQCN